MIVKKSAISRIAPLLLLLGLGIFCHGCIFDNSDEPDPYVPPPPAPPLNPPSGSLSASVPVGSSFDFSEGTVDNTGQSGDFRYESEDIIGLVAPSGVSWWTGNFEFFVSCISDPSYLPPSEAWTHDSGTSGSSGEWARWLKTEEGNYAMIFSVNATPSQFDFYYVEPYGSYTWSDMIAPDPATLISVNPAGAGEIFVQWNHSPSADVAGYWVGFGETLSSTTGKHAGYSTSYTLTELTSGQSYYVRVTAYDIEGNQSGDSNILSAIAG